MVEQGPPNDGNEPIQDPFDSEAMEQFLQSQQKDLFELLGMTAVTESSDPESLGSAGSTPPAPDEQQPDQEPPHQA